MSLFAENSRSMAFRSPAESSGESGAMTPASASAVEPETVAADAPCAPPSTSDAAPSASAPAGIRDADFISGGLFAPDRLLRGLLRPFLLRNLLRRFLAVRKIGLDLLRGMAGGRHRGPQLPWRDLELLRPVTDLVGLAQRNAHL